MNVLHSTTLHITPTRNGAVQRVRTPHANDVLSGRGGSVNGHAGNVQFRKWVRVRKNDYNLANSKVDKARVAQQVIELVRSQDPPGRFLQKDRSAVGNWWVELDEDRVVAKTSQALREGAPLIRAAHQRRPQVRKVGHRGATTAKLRKNETIPTKAAGSPTPAHSNMPPLFINQEKTIREPNKAAFSHMKRNQNGWPTPADSNMPPLVVNQEKTIRELQTNVERARLWNDLLENDPVIRAEKRRRTDELGNSVPPAPINIPPRQGFANEQRQNSLALSEISFDPATTPEFVNPFEDESSADELLAPPPQTIIAVENTPDPGTFARICSNVSLDGDDDHHLAAGDHDRLYHDDHSLTTNVVPAIPQEPITLPSPISPVQRSQSTATQVSKLDWEEADPFLAYLNSLDIGVS